MEHLVNNSNIAIATLAATSIFMGSVLFKVIGWWRQDAIETRRILNDVNMTLSKLTVLIEEILRAK